jgi:carbon-monoxide dehydrogenase medium subunit
LSETISLLKNYGEEAKVIAGGTDLVLLLKLREIVPKYLVDITSLKELDYIKTSNNMLLIGALTKHITLEKSFLVKEKANILSEAVSQLGTVQIRNIGTIGGNLCNASPCSDTATPLLAMDAKLKFLTSKGEKIIPIDGFF